MMTKKEKVLKKNVCHPGIYIFKYKRGINIDEK